MKRCVLDLIWALLVVVSPLLWLSPSAAESGLLTVASTQTTAAMELFGHPDAGTAAITPVAAATEICFPHFADGSSWWTGIAVANPGSTTAVVTLRAYNDEGEQIGRDSNQIVASQSQMAPAVIHNLFALGAIETGWIKLTSTQPVVALEIFGHGGSGGIAGFAPAAAATEVCIPHFAEDSNWWTGIAVANPGAAANQISITAFSDAGQQIGTPYREMIDAGCRMAPQTVRNLISLGQNSSGWLKITAAYPVAVMEIFGHTSSSMIAGLSAGETGNKLYYPYFQEGTSKWTGVAIANPNASSARVDVKAFSSAGNLLGEVNGQPVPAYGRMSPQTITGLFGSLNCQTGTLEISADQPVVGLGLLGDNGSLAGYTPVQGLSAEVSFPHFADSDGWWSKLALMNIADSAASLSMAAYGVDGAVVGAEKIISLAAFAAGLEVLPFSDSATAKEVTRTVGVSGGVLSLTSSAGDTISLEIPLGALFEETEITLSSLASPLNDPIAKNILSGITITPDGTSFSVPAKLKVVFAKPLDNQAAAVLYQVKSAEFIVPLDDLSVTETSIEGYISHLSNYGGGEPSSGEAQAQLEIAMGKIPMSGSSNYQESQEAVSYALAICREMLMKGGNDSCLEEIAQLVLHEVMDFLNRPRPEPPCEPDFISEVLSYYKMMSMIGLPVFDSLELNQAAESVFQQLDDLFQETLTRCRNQYNLIINIDMILDVGLEKNYRGMINVGCLESSEVEGIYVYGTGGLDLSGGGQFGSVTTEVSGVWYVIAEGSIDPELDSNDIPVGATMNISISGQVLETIIASAGDLVVSETTDDYHQEQTLAMSLTKGSNTQIKIDYFDGGISITTVTLERIDDPMSQ